VREAFATVIRGKQDEPDTYTSAGPNAEPLGDNASITVSGTRGAHSITYVTCGPSPESAPRHSRGGLA